MNKSVCVGGDFTKPHIKFIANCFSDRRLIEKMTSTYDFCVIKSQWEYVNVQRNISKTASVVKDLCYRWYRLFIRNFFNYNLQQFTLRTDESL